MRIAIPQYKGTVSGAYELSQTVSLHKLDFQAMAIVDEGSHEFPKVAESFQWFTDKGVQAVVMGTIDPDNADTLSDRGIHVFTGAGDMSPAETVQQFLQLMRSAIERQHGGGGCCGGHGHDHGDEGCCGGKGHEEGHECSGEGGDDHECCHGAGHADGGECCGKHKH